MSFVLKINAEFCLDQVQPHSYHLLQNNSIGPIIPNLNLGQKIEFPCANDGSDDLAVVDINWLNYCSQLLENVKIH